MNGQTNAYIGGHHFEVLFDYEPEIKGSFGRDGGEEPRDEYLEITSISLGEINVTALIYENATDLYDKIYSQVSKRIREGDL